MIIAINKPKGPTSFDLVAKVRKITGIKKVGHAGTLDPLASGVLVVAIGREDTKKINLIVEKEKEYLADIKLGQVSESDDAQGLVKNDFQFSIFNFQIILNIKYSIFFCWSKPNLSKIKNILKKFIGEIDQVPPQYSAIKINGRPAYKSARQGKKIEFKPRSVLIKNIEIVSYDYPDLKIRVETGPGVYIRSLARDLGNQLGVGAYLSDLVRTRVGEYKLEDCVVVENAKFPMSNKFLCKKSRK